MGRLFDDAFNDFVAPLGGSAEASSTRSWMPAVDIAETDAELVFHLEVPGLSKEDLEITVENNVLGISGERRFEDEENRERYHRIERAYGRFSRAFSLRADVDTDRISARIDNGVLTVKLPKAEKARPRRIDIK
jgi:HSP20 family protein